MELPGLGELLQRNDGLGVARVRMTAGDWRTVSLELLAQGQYVLHIVVRGQETGQLGKR